MRYREMRFPCDYAAELCTGDAVRPVVVVNVSAHGARVARVAGLEPGDEVDLLLPVGRFAARVRWQYQGRAGLRFDLPLPAGVVALLRRQTRVAPATAGRWNPHLREMV